MSYWSGAFGFLEFVMANQENREQEYPSEYNEKILEIIYTDANESFKHFRDEVNLMNARLSVLIGFNATFIGLLPRISVQNSSLIQKQSNGLRFLLLHFFFFYQNFL